MISAIPNLGNFSYKSILFMRYIIYHILVNDNIVRLLWPKIYEKLHCFVHLICLKFSSEEMTFRNIFIEKKKTNN